VFGTAGLAVVARRRLEGDAAERDREQPSVCSDTPLAPTDRSIPLACQNRVFGPTCRS